MRVALGIVLASSAVTTLVFGAPAPLPEGEASSLVARAGTKKAFDCTNKPGICANICFAANCGHKKGVSLAAEGGKAGTTSTGDLTYQQGIDSANRKVSGYTFAKTVGGKNSLTNAKIDQGGTLDTSVDEWPPASTKEGGSGATLRFVPVSEQRSQGGQTYKTGSSPLHYYELSNWV